MIAEEKSRIAEMPKGSMGICAKMFQTKGTDHLNQASGRYAR